MKFDSIMINDREVGPVDEFCHLGSLITARSICDKEVKICIGKANAALGKF